MPREFFEQYEDPRDRKLKKRRQSGIGRQESLQPVIFEGGIPSAERARRSGITSAALVNLLTPQDYSGTGATGAADAAIRGSRRIKRDRQVAQLLSTLGGQQIQEEGATKRTALSNIADLQKAGLSRQTALETAASGREGALEKQRLIGTQGLTERGLAEDAAMDRLRFKTSAAEEAQTRGLEESRKTADIEEERQRERLNQARAFELFKGGDVKGAERLGKSRFFAPSYSGLTPPQAQSTHKYIPGQKISVKGLEQQLPGKVFNVETGEIETDISDLSPEERDALLEILETRKPQGLR